MKEEMMLAEHQEESTQGHMFNSNTMNADLVSSYESCNAKQGSSEVPSGKAPQISLRQSSVLDNNPKGRPTEFQKTSRQYFSKTNRTIPENVRSSN